MSPGGDELLTKNNECPGTKSTVLWDAGAGKPTEGCFEDDSYDLDPREEGVQAECDVVDQTLEFYTPPVLTGGGTKDCAKVQYYAIQGDGGTYNFTGTCEQVQILGNKNKVTFDKVKKVQVEGQQNVVSGNQADNIDLFVEAGSDGKAPPDTTMVTGLTDPVTEGGKPPQPNVQIAKLDLDKAEKSRVVKQVAIKDQCPEEEPGDENEVEKACWMISEQPAVCGKVDAGMAARNLVKHIPEFGVLVKYPDENIRDRTTKIVAKCKAAAKPTAPADVYADQPQRIHEGETTLRTRPLLTEEQRVRARVARPAARAHGMFLTIYFAMTGLHGIHVLVGVLSSSGC